MKTFRYRLYTEDLNRKTLARLFDRHFNSYSVQEQKGVWNGKAEKSLVFEIICDEREALILPYIAEDIKLHNKQEAVLITTEQITEVLI